MFDVNDLVVYLVVNINYVHVKLINTIKYSSYLNVPIRCFRKKIADNNTIE